MPGQALLTVILRIRVGRDDRGVLRVKPTHLVVSARNNQSEQQ